MTDGNQRPAFRLGGWLVEPGHKRVTKNGVMHTLSSSELRLLMRLVETHGEAVEREALKKAGWPDREVGDYVLRRTVHSLRELLGDDPRNPKHIIAVPHDGYALIAHYELVDKEPRPVALTAPAPERPIKSAGEADGSPATGKTPGNGSGRSMVDRLASLLFELRRRHVLRVGGAYLVGMWIVLQIAEVTFEPLHFPDWWLTALTILTILGLPIVVTLAWSYEITASGIEIDGRAPTVHLPKARQAVAPVAVIGVALLAGVTGYAWWSTLDIEGERPDGVPKNGTPSIAVLPLNDFSPAESGGYLGDGLSEELSSQLAMVPGLRVAARTSAFAFKGKNIDVRQIGDKLGVRYVMEGSIRRDADRVRVTVQLIDASNGYHVWTQSYDRPWQDLITIQQEISRAITQKLRVVLSPEEAEQVLFATTDDPRAYDFYLAGLSELRRGGGVSRVDEAERLFTRSLEIDPDFARAHAGLCEASIQRFERTSDPDAMVRAEAACRRALETGTTLRETELALARLYTTGGRHEQAEAVYRRLIEASPSHAEAYIGLGESLQGQGRVEAAEEAFREAVVVEPGYWMTHNRLGTFLFSHGRAKEAVQSFERVTEMVPGNPNGFNNLGAAQMLIGDLAGAAASFQRSNELEPSRSAYSNLGTINYYLGQFPEAVAMYSRAITLAPEDYMLWGSRADSLWFMEGRRDAAIEGYRRAIELAERHLQVNDTEGITWALLAYYYNRVGDTDRAARYTRRAMELHPDSPFVNYFAALAAADRGEIEESNRLAKRAVEYGFPMPLIMADPALPGMRTG